MEIFRDIANVKRLENAVLTVGTFDGLHLGHQFIVEKLKNRAEFLNAQTTLVTFNPHPQIVLKSPDKPDLKILTTVDEKIEILRTFDIDRLLVIEFTHEFSKTTPVEFVKKVLYETVGFKEMVTGHDHAFGKDRQGDFETLKKLAQELEFSVTELGPFKIEEDLVSSTKIRTLLLGGDIKSANKLLGRNYFVNGKIVGGEGRGRDLNFPTANIELDSRDKLIPGDGVYAVYAFLGSKKVAGMMNIGVRPTFVSGARVMEVNLFDFHETIYGKKMKIEFVERIRDEKRFSGPDELVAQLKKDQEKSLNILRN
ncbi:MAG: bifunctional riboflavin kinase/FAD synthetase [Caldithrix sp.]|nr:MAG: bifunctional riboflavin kinase/FAD synthetase [Caldithrix sp.]TDI94368.1 MAG: bifunctional riboflavin kinase/FAD synthetase [Caldithrix sp.]